MSDLGTIASTLEEFEFPKKITFEVCSECNLDCSMCYLTGMRRKKGVMPFELWRKCADQIRSIAPATDCWFSFCGEPLVEPDLLFGMLHYGKSIGLSSLNVNTNGTLLNRDVADRLVDTGVDLVVIGVDGFSKAVYEKIRVGGDRDQLYQNIDYLCSVARNRNSGPEIQVQFIEMDENENELSDFLKFWLDRGTTVKVRKKLSWGGNIETKLAVPSDQRIPCPWAVTLMHVCWDGRVPRCPGDTEAEECAGNAQHEPLAVLWDRLGSYRKAHLEYRFAELPEKCRDCSDWMVGVAERHSPNQHREPIEKAEAKA